MTQRLRVRLGLHRSPSYWKVLVAICAGIVTIGAAITAALPYLNAPGRIDDTSATLAVMQRNQIEWQIKRAGYDAKQDTFQIEVLARLNSIDIKLSRNGITLYPFSSPDIPSSVLVTSNETQN